MFVVVGVSGGIAAYKAVQLVRLLVQDGHEVHVVPTPDAVRFVGIPTWEAISRRPVTTSVHDDVASVRHVALGQAADLVIVAPATANTMAKMAAGAADDLLGTTLLATEAPVVIAPAMHTEMWNHPATQHNLAVLRARGVHVVGPESGELTGGDSGPGRMSEPEQIRDAALAAAQTTPAAPQDLTGTTVLVSTGGTREPLDPVRFIGNRSSGRQGAAVALAAADRGADVRLIAAHVDDGVLADAVAHPGVTIARAGTAAELSDAVRAAAADADIVVMAAAVSDYRLAQIPGRKMAKEDSEDAGLTLQLEETDDILAGLVRDRRPGQTIVGFAAETPGDDETLHDRARRKVRRKGADLLVANEVGWSRGFESSDNDVLIVDADGELLATATGSKQAVADALWDVVAGVRAHDDADR